MGNVLYMCKRRPEDAIYRAASSEHAPVAGGGTIYNTLEEPITSDLEDDNVMFDRDPNRSLYQSTEAEITANPLYSDNSDFEDNVPPHKTAAAAPPSAASATAGAPVGASMFTTRPVPPPRLEMIQEAGVKDSGSLSGSVPTTNHHQHDPTSISVPSFYGEENHHDVLAPVHDSVKQLPNSNEQTSENKT